MSAKQQPDLLTTAVQVLAAQVGRYLNTTVCCCGSKVAGPSQLFELMSHVKWEELKN
jgi:hypothetical protein